MFFGLNKLQKWQRITPQLINNIIDKVNRANNLRVSGASLSSNSKGMSIAVGGGTGPNIRRAKAQEAGTTETGLLSVKFVDSAGDVVGDAFNVYVLPDRSAADMGEYWPPVAINQIVLIAKEGGAWYLGKPDLSYVDKWV